MSFSIEEERFNSCRVVGRRTTRSSFLSHVLIIDKIVEEVEENAFDIEVEDAHNFFADSVLTHNSQVGAGSVEIFDAGEADILSCEGGKIVFELPDGPVAGRYVCIQTNERDFVLRQFPPSLEHASKPDVRLLGKRTDPYEDKAVKAFEKGSVMEEKIDGACAGWKTDKEGRVELTSPRLSKKTGNPIRYTHKLPNIRRDFPSNLKNASGEGELWHRRGPNFVAAVLNSNPFRARLLQRKYGPVRLKLFNLNEEKPYAERYEALREIAKSSGPSIELVKQHNPKSPESAISFAEWCRSDSKSPRDGFVAKDPDAVEVAWHKGKPTDAHDLAIRGFTPGEGKMEGSLGSLQVECADGSIVSIGTGFSDFQRNWIWEHKGELMDEVVQIEFHERSNTDLIKTGGRFVGFHPSKSEVGLLMYAETLADGTDRSPEDVKYALISAKGWRKK